MDTKLPEIISIDNPRSCKHCIFCCKMFILNEYQCRLRSQIDTIHHQVKTYDDNRIDCNASTCSCFIDEQTANKLSAITTLEEFKINIDLESIVVDDFIKELFENHFKNDNTASTKQINYALSIACRYGLCVPMELYFENNDMIHKTIPYIEICENKRIIWEWTNEHITINGNW